MDINNKTCYCLFIRGIHPFIVCFILTPRAFGSLPIKSPNIPAISVGVRLPLKLKFHLRGTQLKFSALPPVQR